MAKYRTFAFTDDIHRLFAPSNLPEKEAVEEISRLLQSNNPFMISRFGSCELQAIFYEKYRPFSFFMKHRAYFIENNAGVFGLNSDICKRFYQQYREDAKQIDVLVQWRVEELFFQSWVKKAIRISKNTLDEFYRQEQSWTYALEGKRVLVVHPFAETIESQYKKRTLLFKNPLVLPEFKSLETVKAVLSIAGQEVGFKDWFEALDYQKHEIDKHDYDVALIGCGAYGLPLAAHCKRMGKQAIHMGGILQFLFGITGKRYDESPKTAQYINEHFVHPSINDKPKDSIKVEGGCYW